MTTEEKKECWLCRNIGEMDPDTDVEDYRCGGCGKLICPAHTGDTFMRHGHDPIEHIDDEDEFQL